MKGQKMGQEKQKYLRYIMDVQIDEKNERQKEDRIRESIHIKMIERQ